MKPCPVCGLLCLTRVCLFCNLERASGRALRRVGLAAAEQQSPMVVHEVEKEDGTFVSALVLALAARGKKPWALDENREREARALAARTAGQGSAA